MEENAKDMAERIYVVPDMSCAHCTAAVAGALAAVPGVRTVDVDLATKRVAVRGDGLSDGVLRAAIAGAGYEAD